MKEWKWEFLDFLNIFLECIKTERGIKQKGWKKEQTLGLL